VSVHIVGPIAGVLHRIALLAYPPAFRREFGREVHRIFQARVDRAGRRRTAIALFCLFDTIASGIAERGRELGERWAWPRHFVPSASGSQTMTWGSLSADLRFAIRHFKRAPMFAALTAASLAFGIGANAAMFAVVHAVLLAPLPYNDTRSLVVVWSDNAAGGQPLNPVSGGNFEAFRAAPALAATEAMQSFVNTTPIRIGNESISAVTSTITPGMFSLLGRQPILGRTFQPGEPQPVAVLSYDFWMRQFGGDRAVVGRTLTPVAPGQPIEIAGVMPPDFKFPYGSMLFRPSAREDVRVDFWLPLLRQTDPWFFDTTGQPNRSVHHLVLIGRLAPGMSIDRARTDLAAIAKRREAEFPDTNARWGVTVNPLHEQVVGGLRPALLLLLGGVGIVLLVTCINVANVLLARAAGRSRDLSVRSALGASRARLVQQMLVETLLLSFAGGIAGLVVMDVATRAILAMAPPNLPRLGEVSPGLPVVLFSFALALVTGIAVGVFPALTVARSSGRDSLRDGTRTTMSAARRRTRAALIVAEVALAMALTVCGGLLLRSFTSVLAVDPGFRAENLLTMQVRVPTRYSGREAQVTFYDALDERLRAVPGVVSLGGTTRLPLGSSSVTTMLDVEGRAVPPTERPEVELRRAVLDYFTAMRIPLLQGRTFTREDTMTTDAVVVVNNALASQVFPDGNAVGSRVRMGSSTGQWFTIIGVVGNIKHGSLEEVPRPEIYQAHRQFPPTNPFMVVRTSGDSKQAVTGVRQALRELGVDRPAEMSTMEAVRSQSIGARRFLVLLVGIFAALALGLAALGVFGVITLVAAERTGEVGIRLALGATPSQVMQMMLGQAVRLTLAGIAAGTAAALLLAPYIKAQLFGIGATDPITYLGVTVVLVLAALMAAYVPARRAMKVDPADALRTS
jgi:putative ABC transport system permease protein